MSELGKLEVLDVRLLAKKKDVCKLDEVMRNTLLEVSRSSLCLTFVRLHLSPLKKSEFESSGKHCRKITQLQSKAVL